MQRRWDDSRKGRIFVMRKRLGGKLEMGSREDARELKVFEIMWALRNHGVSLEEITQGLTARGCELRDEYRDAITIPRALRIVRDEEETT
jgi:hypothetical protein